MHETNESLLPVSRLTFLLFLRGTSAITCVQWAAGLLHISVTSSKNLWQIPGTNFDNSAWSSWTKYFIKCLHIQSSSTYFIWTLMLCLLLCTYVWALLSQLLSQDCSLMMKYLPISEWRVSLLVCVNWDHIWGGDPVCFPCATVQMYKQHYFVAMFLHL